MFTEFLLALNEMNMTEPPIWGWWHLMWIGIAVGLSVFFYVAKKKGLKIPENLVFGIYGFLTLFLEILKQLMWAVSKVDGAVYWSYSWYSAPFQFCTTVMYVCIALCFVKNKKARQYLYSFLMYFGIISMSLVLVTPGDIFVRNIWINIHTSVMHFGGFAVCMFAIINRKAAYKPKNVLKGAAVFLGFVLVALLLDVAVVMSGINRGNTFNMFYISPYYPCTLPVFADIYKAVPYPVFLLIYLAAFTAGAFVVLGIIWAFVSVARLFKNDKNN